jgi:hypothetical protein
MVYLFLFKGGNDKPIDESHIGTQGSSVCVRKKQKIAVCALEAKTESVHENDGSVSLHLQGLLLHQINYSLSKPSWL